MRNGRALLPGSREDDAADEGLDPPAVADELAGEVVIIYGSAVAGLSPVAGVGGGGSQLFHELTPGIPDDGIYRGDYFGFSLATADFNGDLFADLAIGSFFPRDASSRTSPSDFRFMRNTVVSELEFFNRAVLGS